MGKFHRCTVFFFFLSMFGLLPEFRSDLNFSISHECVCRGSTVREHFSIIYASLTGYVRETRETKITDRSIRPEKYINYSICFVLIDWSNEWPTKYSANNKNPTGDFENESCHTLFLFRWIKCSRKGHFFFFSLLQYKLIFFFFVCFLFIRIMYIYTWKIYEIYLIFDWRSIVKPDVK